MQEHLSKAKVQFKFFFLYFLISNLYCKDIYNQNINDNIKAKQIIQDQKEDKVDNITNYILEYGNVYNLNLYFLKTINIKMNKKEDYHLLVHFYPLDCKIYLTDEKDNEDRFHNISNYNYDAFYALIHKDRTFSFKIRPLIFLNFLILFT